AAARGLRLRRRDGAPARGGRGAAHPRRGPRARPVAGGPRPDGRADRPQEGRPGRGPARRPRRARRSAAPARAGPHRRGPARRRAPRSAAGRPALRGPATKALRTLCGVPELPEVEITARRIAAAVRGVEIESTLAPGINALKTFDPPLHALDGRAVEGVRRIG